MNMIKTPADHDRFLRALAITDGAFRESERKWGVGRLEVLVGFATLENYQKGWALYRAALESGDGAAVEEIGPKMVAALAYMDAEATRLGHRPLAPETWEAPMSDGTVLVIVRTNAEASAALRGEGNLPPDLTATVRDQHEGRRLVVWTLSEIAHFLEAHGNPMNDIKAGFPGATVRGTLWEGQSAWTGAQRDEGLAADVVRSGYPLEGPLT